MPDSSSRPLRNLYALSCLVVLIAALYFARSVLVPVVLAVLLTFLLSPLMLALERRGLGRLPAAAAVVLAALLLIASTGLLISRQLQHLLVDLPNHREAIVAKIEALRESASESWLSGLSETLTEVRERLAQSRDADPADRPTQVQIVPSQLSFAHSALTPMAEWLLAAALVLVLTFFMLLRREDMRNRLIGLWGTRRLLTATRALDDAGSRISSFLVMQLIVNAAFGVVFGLGLFALGVPYPLLGGFIAGLMRYIPFVGVWVAGAGPVLLSVALLPGWSHVLFVVLLLTVVEITFAHLIEPIAFGKSIGVSEVALLIALAFWGWLWGVAGLILATPLTACLVVVARNIPRLRFLAKLLGDEPAMKPAQVFYQRLVAGDKEEADRLVTAYRVGHSTEDVYAHLFLPVLRLARAHANSGQITPEERGAIYRQLHDLLPAGLAVDADAPAPVVLGFASGEEPNELALQLFARLLPRTVAFRVEPAKTLTAELIGQTREEAPGVIVLGVVLPDAARQTRLLVKRLRLECPKSRILVGWWSGRRLSAGAKLRFLEAGADGVAESLTDARVQLSALLPVAEQAAREEALVTG